MADVPDFMRDVAVALTGANTEAETRLREFGALLARSAAPDPAPPRPPFVPGVFTDMPAETYFAIEAMSQSGTKTMLRTPQHYRLERDQPSEPTAAMQFGTAVHTGVLQPDRFDATVARMRKVDGRTKAGKEYREGFKRECAGMIVLDEEEHDAARRCIDAVRAHPGARHLLRDAITETSLFWVDREFDVPCKARLDIRSHGGITDLKTTQDASPDAYARSIATFAYDVQAAFYFSGHEHLLDATPEFFAHIAVESEPPHAVACYVIGSASILAGRRLADTALARYAQALRTGHWQGYPDTIEVIETPAWRRRFY